MLKYFLNDEIVCHNKRTDFWVVIHDNVLNLTPFVSDRFDHWNDHMEYLMAFGGKDLSHLFYPNGLPRTETSPVTGRPRVLFPPILELAMSDMCKTKGCIWSQDPLYHIGRRTRCERRLRIINTLTATTQLMKVCDEDTIYDIQRKYRNRYNHHAGSYLWRKFSYGGKCEAELNLEGTLADNDLTNPETNAELPPPSIWLYYTDDVTVG